jgi:hypothetical protein
MTAAAFPRRRVSPAPREAVGAGCGIPRVTGPDTLVNAKLAYSPCRRSVIFVTLW